MAKPKIKKSDAVAHVVDVVRQNHKMRRSDVEEQLQQMGFFRNDAIDIVSAAIKKGLVRSAGSDLRPAEMSKEPHIEQDYMTGWWGVYVGGEYKGQRPEKAQAQTLLRELTATDPFEGL